MAIQSMTGFVQITGAADVATWVWDVRSVNGRGLDLRIRLPEGCESLEPMARCTCGIGVTVTAGIRPGVGSCVITRAIDASPESGVAEATPGLA